MKYALIFCLLLSASFPTSAVYICIDKQGKKTYQDKSCDKKNEQQSEMQFDSGSTIESGSNSKWFAMERYGDCLSLEHAFRGKLNFLAKANSPLQLKSKLVEAGYDASLESANLKEYADVESNSENATKLAAFKVYALTSTGASLSMIIVNQAVCDAVAENN